MIYFIFWIESYLDYVDTVSYIRHSGPKTYDGCSHSPPVIVPLVADVLCDHIVLAFMFWKGDPNDSFPSGPPFLLT